MLCTPVASARRSFCSERARCCSIRPCWPKSIRQGRNPGCGSEPQPRKKSSRPAPSLDAVEGEGSFVTETTELSPAVETSSATGSSTAAPAKSSGLAGLKLAQLQALASQLGISGGSRMRKGDLVSAISAHRAGTPVSKAPARAAEKATDNGTVAHAAAPAAAGDAEAPAQENPRARGRGRSRRAGSDGIITAPAAGAPAAAPAAETAPAAEATAETPAVSGGTETAERRQPRTRNRRRGEAAAAGRPVGSCRSPGRAAPVRRAPA